MKRRMKTTDLSRSLPVFLLLACVGWPTAAESMKGDSTLSLGLGLGLPISDLDLSRIGAGSQKPGEPGLAIDGRYLYQVDDRLGLGGEIAHRNFGDKDFVVPRLAGTIGSSLIMAQALARYLFVPEESLSPYLIGGLGLNQFKSRVRKTFDPGDVLLDTDSTGLTFSAGGGLEAALSESTVVGVETRWLLSTIDSNKFGAGTLSTLDFAARLGFKF